MEVKAIKSLSAVTVLLILGSYFGCSQPPTNTRPEPDSAKKQGVDVELGEVKRGKFIDVEEGLPVQIQGYESSKLMSRIEAYVGEVFVDIGDEMSKGQVLARLDVPEMEAEQRRKEKLVDQAVAKLNSQRSEVTRARAQRAEQGALLRKWESELNRVRSLVQEGVFKDDQLDEAQFSHDAVLAAIERVVADIQVEEAHVASAQAAVEVAQAELEKTHALMGYMEIKAPFDGVITERMVDPGDFVRPPSSGNTEMHLFRIESVQRLRAVVWLDITDASRLDNGDLVEFELVFGVSANDLKMVSAVGGGPLRISRHAKVFRYDRKNMRAEIDVDNPAVGTSGRRVLKPGDYGKVSIRLAEYEDVPSVAISSIGRNENGNYIMLVDANHACQQVSVEILFQDDERAALSGDVRVGDRIVAKGVDAVKHGQMLAK